MRSRIVHSYFLRFRHIIRQFRHFVFRIDSYGTDRSAIFLRVAANTRTKPTGAPPIVKRTNMTLTMPIPFDIFLKPRPVCGEHKHAARCLAPILVTVTSPAMGYHGITGHGHSELNSSRWIFSLLIPSFPSVFI